MQMNIFLKDKPLAFEENSVIAGKEKPTTVIFHGALSVKLGIFHGGWVGRWQADYDHTRIYKLQSFTPVTEPIIGVVRSMSVCLPHRGFRCPIISE